MWKNTRSSKKKSVDLLYANDKEAEEEIRKISSSTIATSNIKNLEVTLAEEVEKPVPQEL